MTTSIDALLRMQKTVEKYEKKYRKSATELEKIMRDTDAMTKLKIQRTNKENTLCSCKKLLKKLKYDIVIRNYQNEQLFRLIKFMTTNERFHWEDYYFRKNYTNLYIEIKHLFDDISMHYYITDKRKTSPFVLLMQYMLQQIKKWVFQGLFNRVREKLKENTEITIVEAISTINYFDFAKSQISKNSENILNFYKNNIEKVYEFKVEDEDDEDDEDELSIKHDLYLDISGYITRTLNFLTGIMTWQLINDDYRPFDWEYMTQKLQMPPLIQTKNEFYNLLDTPEVIIEAIDLKKSFKKKKKKT